MNFKYLKNFYTFINESNLNEKRMILEALEPKVEAFYLEINGELRDKRLKEIWNKLSALAEFSKKNGDRLYFKSFEMENEDFIYDYLSNKGFEVKDYKGNQAYDIKNDRPIKITKVLSNIGQFDNYALDLLKEYNNEASKGIELRGKRVDGQKYVVLSKDPIDIAEMSTGRKWTSCTNVYDGGNKDYVSYDIYEGTFIAYLIEKDDIDIENPDARILIKPYYDISDINSIYFFTEDKVYGEAPSSFLKTVNSIIEKVQSIKKPTALKLIDTLYCDNPSYKKRIKGTVEDPNSKEYLELYLEHIGVKEYKINEDMSVDVFGSVWIAGLKIKRIPIKFGTVFGNFICKDNELVTLNNAPKKVTGYFDCSNNNLTSLKGGPVEVEDSYYCNSNVIKTLQGGPKIVEKDFVFSENFLTSLEGFPEKVGRVVQGGANRIQTLKHLPKQINGDLTLDHNELVDLEFSPEIVKGDFTCKYNKLNTLRGGPKRVEENYDVSSNLLMTLEGSPEYVGGDFVIKNNPDITSLEFSPKQINGYFYAYGCYGLDGLDWETKNKFIKAKGYYFS